jgi:hypothetical protein
MGEGDHPKGMVRSHFASRNWGMKVDFRERPHARLAETRPHLERGTVPYFLADSEKSGQSPSLLARLPRGGGRGKIVRDPGRRDEA